MKQRVLTGVLLALLFIPVLCFSHTLFFRIVLGVLSLLCVFEMQRCTGCGVHGMLLFPALAIGFCAPLAANSFGGGVLLSLSMVYLVFSMFTMVLSDGRITVEKACVSFATTMFIASSFASIIMIRNIEPAGYIMYIMVFLGSWMSDVGAYFTGALIGKHKLIPNISPKKTVEGAVGGVVSCVLSFVIYAFLAANIKKVIPFFPIGDIALEPNYLMIAASGVIVSIISQFGDLVASAIKRCYGVKDYGTIFPGHGGVLDRFDSVLAVAPLFYMFAGRLVELF